MSDVFKFPNGYDVTVLRKEDVIKSIHDNIIDTDIALAIIEKLEIDSSAFLKQGRWVGIPFMGNLRIPPIKKLTMDDEHQALVQEAREKLDSRRYILFRKELAAKDAKTVKKERYFKYVVSLIASRNKKLYQESIVDFGKWFFHVY